MEKILQNYGIQNLKKSGDEIICCCPFHKEQNPSFSINSKTGSFICFSGKCGLKGDFYRFKSLIEGITYDEAKKELQLNHSQFYYRNLISESLDNLKEQEEFKIEENHTETLEVRSIFDFNDYKEVLTDINISEPIAKQVGLSICMQKPYKGRLAVPIIKDNVVYWELRDLTKTSDRKCLYTKGTKVGKLLFFVRANEDKIIFLCEGTKDVMTTAGFGFNACCCFGLNISEKQIALILKNGFNKIFILYDNDEAGFNGMKKNFHFIKKYIDTEFILYPENFPYKDPNEIKTKEEFIEVLKYNV
ncbi:MAG: CHC2 zinc finger domain-containing protein [Staphylococcus sp.]|nr:CHC2 zinc finger domain-containing protein [Staphylococcus sp.]